MTRLPPPRVVRAATRAADAVQNLARRMVPPEIGLLELASGFMATHAIYAAAKLGIADALADGPLPAKDIAARVGSDPDATHRLLRACATFGVFTEKPDGRFGLTALARASAFRDPRLDAAGHPDARRPAVPAAVGTTGRHGRNGHARRRDGLRQADVGAPRRRTRVRRHVQQRHDSPVGPGLADGESGVRLHAVRDDRRHRRRTRTAPGVDARRVSVGQGCSAGTRGSVESAEEHLREAGVLARCRIETGSFFDTAPVRR